MTQVATPPQTLKPSAEGEGWKARPIRLKIFGNLIAEVVHKGICMYCGACIASCPIDILFHSDNEEPIFSERKFSKRRSKPPRLGPCQHVAVV